MKSKKKILLGILIIFVPFLLFCLGWAVLEIYNQSRPSIHSLAIPINPEHFMSFEQQQEADLIVDIHSWEKIVLSKPRQAKIGNEFFKHFTRDQFPQVMTANEIGRDLVVILLGKGMVPREYVDNETAYDDMEEYFLEQGFQRVVILEDSNHLIPAGFPILRDSEKKQKEVL